MQTIGAMRHQPARRRITIQRALLLAFVTLALTAGTVFAASAELYGHLNQNGSNTWFNTYRYHDHTGTISANINNLPNSNGILSLGLRNNSGGQFSNTQTWTSYTSKDFIGNGGSSNQFGPINFAINGRMGACGIFCDDDFGGWLYY